MKILLASSEVHPYSKTGGLADMVGALARALAAAGHEVGVVTPLYQGIRERVPALSPSDLTLDFPLGPLPIQGKVWTLAPRAGLTIYFIEQPAFFDRACLYQERGADYPDNGQRFIFFSKAVAHLARHLPWRPEVMHVQDWQTGLVPLLLAHDRRTGSRENSIPTCMTIHNLAYQGLFPANHYSLTNLPWDYFAVDGAEFYGQLSCLKAGIAFGDVVTTVSPRYAREIATPDFGCGLDGLLRQRQDSLFGVLNGVDYEEWTTVNNPYLRHPYSSSDLTGKTGDKLALQEALGLPPNPQVPLFGNIGRMVEQKGVEILLASLDEILSHDLQFVALGTGTPAFERAYEELAARFPSKVAVRVGFDECLSHQIEAACDFFVMPSRFEPCGLNQMYSLRYGTIPIVRATGGLDDTVTDIRENLEKSNGIKFGEYSASALTKAFRKALALYQEPALFQQFRLNAMAADFSWERTAVDYVNLYRKAVEGG